MKDTSISVATVIQWPIEIRTEINNGGKEYIQNTCEKISLKIHSKTQKHMALTGFEPGRPSRNEQFLLLSLMQLAVSGLHRCFSNGGTRTVAVREKVMNLVHN
jgi:hypothetical protein